MSNLTIEVWPITDPGGSDQENEDAILLYQPPDPQTSRFSGSLYIVVDGMGGGARGRQAAEYVAYQAMTYYYESQEPDLGLRLRQVLSQVNADLYTYTQSRPELVKMGATVVAAVLRGEQAHVASVGDGRAYLIRDNSISQITRDHTLVQQLLDENAITADEAQNHPRRDVVLRMLGSERSVNIDLFDLRLRPDDSLLLCSDGLTRYLHDDEIARIVSTMSPRNAATTLIQKVLDRGGKDNVSVMTMLARDGAPPLEPNVPHVWDGAPGLLDEQSTMRVARTPSPDEGPVNRGDTVQNVNVAQMLETRATAPPPSDGWTDSRAPEPSRPAVVWEDAGASDTAFADETTPMRRSEMPAPTRQQDVQPAPTYERPVQPAPQYSTQQSAPPSPQAAAAPPPGYAVDPVTGLSPVPASPQAPDGPQGWSSQQAGQYGAPRGYSSPPQQSRGISLGLFAFVGVLAVMLTILMVFVLINPFGWQLPFGGDSAADQPAEATSAVVEEDTGNVEGGAPTTDPAAPTTDPNAAAPTTDPGAGGTDPQVTAPPAQPTPTTGPVVAPTPPNMIRVDAGTFTRGVTDEEADQAVLSCIADTDDDTLCFREFFIDAQP
ncbi:MAG: SpoIIE family protein phosphatase, partial [Chloroflexi bacterium]|nr:SpoIIE family protein phosphatase [Chloroflexota bacterium]